MLCRVRLKNMGEVGCLRLRWDTQAVGSEPRETSLGIHSRLGNPDGMILLDGSLDSSLEPQTVGFHIRAIKLVVDLESHIGEERRLSSAQVVRSTAVEDLAVVFDLENKVVDHTLGHVHLTVD